MRGLRASRASGAMRLRSNAAYHLPKPPLNAAYLIKTHGIEYGSDPANGRLASELAAYLERRFGPCDATSVYGIVRVTRNLFDSLGARFHLSLKENRSTPEEFGSYVRNDVCVLLRWAHRARHAADWCPTITLRYEELQLMTSSFLGTLADALQTISETPASWSRARTCASKVIPRNLTVIGTQVVPEYVAGGWFSAKLLQYVAHSVERYLNQSDMFRSPHLLPCAPRPVTPRPVSRKVERSSAKRQRSTVL